MPEATDLNQALGRSNSAVVLIGLQKPVFGFFFFYLLFHYFPFPGYINLQRILSHVLKLAWPEELILSKTSLFSLTCVGIH